MRRLLIPLLVLALGCAKKQPDAPAPAPAAETGVLEVKFLGFADGTLFEPGASLRLPDGRPWTLDMLRFYITDLELLRADGGADTLADVRLLNIDPTKNSGKTAHGPGATLEFRVPVGEYAGLRFRLGLDSLRNASDPARFGPEHPLSAMKGMFWTWNTGYRFAMCEGEIDVSAAGDGSRMESFSYHPGANDMSRALSFTGPEPRILVARDGIRHCNVEMELDSLFYGAGAVPFMETRQAHGGASTRPAARALMNRLAAGCRLFIE